MPLLSPRLRVLLRSLAPGTIVHGREAKRELTGHEITARGVILGGVLGLHAAILAALLSYRLLLPEGPSGPVIRLDTLPPVASRQDRALADAPLLPVPLPDLTPELPVQGAAAATEEPVPQRRAPEEIIAEEALTPVIAAHTLGARGFDLMAPPGYRAAHLRNRLPEYPAIARRRGQEGVVILRVLVNPVGKSQSVEIYKSSGYARLDQAARQAVLGWTFTPAERGRQPVTAWLLIPIRFAGGTRVLVDETVAVSG